MTHTQWHTPNDTHPMTHTQWHTPNDTHPMTHTQWHTLWTKWMWSWVMSHIWMRHVPHMNESCPTYEWVMSHINQMNVSIPFKEPFSLSCHDPMTHTQWHTPNDTHPDPHGHFNFTNHYVTWLIHVCDMTLSCVWHDLFICVTWLIHTCETIHDSHVWHDSFICATWVMTHSFNLNGHFNFTNCFTNCYAI